MAQFFLSGLVLLVAAGCSAAQADLAAPTATVEAVRGVVSPTPSLTETAVVPTVTPHPTATTTGIPSPTASPTTTPVPEPVGCLEPPDDYTRVEVNGWQLNRRTLVMLEHAADLYGGELEITGHHITQGSYTPAEPASFGTHDGGGAVDISVMRKGTWTVLRGEIEPLIQALRAAGFAAWMREYGELYPDSPYHIHAIAIGDADLSPAAQEQLTGTFGYFRGFTGVPIPNGTPAPDRHGGPLLCRWMVDLGYADLRPTSHPDR